MLTIRLQRTGRSGHAQFRLVAQDKRFSPLSGRVVSYLGSYDPHTKQLSVDKDKVSDYLSKGAQPSPRVARLLEKEGVKLPKWVAKPAPKKKTTRNPEKLRKNQPAEPKAEKTDAPAEAQAPAETADTASAEPAEKPKPETEVETPAEEAAPAEAEPAKEEPVAEAEPSKEAPASDEPKA